MRSAIILALTSSTLAGTSSHNPFAVDQLTSIVPFGNVIDAMFGTSNEARQVPPPGQMPSFHPIGTGSGTGFPFATATGAFPTASGGLHTRPHGHGSRPGHHHKSKTLAVDYQLAPTVVPKIGKVEQRQVGNGTSLPSFTLLDPSDGVPQPTTTDAAEIPSSTEGPESSFPTSTDDSAFPIPTATDEPSSPLPTEDPESPFPTGQPAFPTATGQPGFPFPTGGFSMPTGGFPLPTGGFPGTGIPSLPTTLETVTRGPRPTAQPDAPDSTLPGEEDGETGEGDLQSWLDWLESLFGGSNGNGKSEMQT